MQPPPVPGGSVSCKPRAEMLVGPWGMVLPLLPSEVGEPSKMVDLRGSCHERVQSQ